MKSDNEANAGTVVYVVDDDADVRKGLQRLLRSAGYATRGFADGAEYLKTKLNVCDAACLLLDIRMPRMSGMDLQRVLPGTDHDVPIVFLTGHGDIPTCVQAMKAGAYGFLTKPVNDAELLEALAGALSTARERSAERARRDVVQERLGRLSPREREVCDGVAGGLLNKQIAHAMGISEKTVKVHRGRVMEKLEVISVADLVRLTTKAGEGSGAGSVSSISPTQGRGA